MITERSIEVDAPAATVWEVFTDVVAWPTWTASVERVEPLDGPDLGIGRRFRLTQPRFPRLVWDVVALEPGRSWTWRQRSPGGTSLATHDVAPDGDRTLVRLRIEQRGPVGALVGLLWRRLTRRYLDLEAQGLKSRSERLHRDRTLGRDAAPA